MQQHIFFLLRPNGVLMINVHDLYYSYENGTIFIMFAYIELSVYPCIFWHDPILSYLRR